MVTVEERVAFLEGRAGENSQVLDSIRNALVNLGDHMVALEARIDRRFDTFDRRFDAIDRRFEAVDHRFEATDRRFEALDGRFDIIDRRLIAIDQKLDRTTDAIDAKLSRQFTWLVGILVTTLAAMAAAVIGR